PHASPRRRGGRGGGGGGAGHARRGRTPAREGLPVPAGAFVEASRGSPPAWGRGSRGQGVLGPGVARVAATQLAAERRVMTAPEPGQVLGHLDRTLVGGKEVEDERHPTPAQRRSL